MAQHEVNSRRRKSRYLIKILSEKRIFPHSSPNSIDPSETLLPSPSIYLTATPLLSTEGNTPRIALHLTDINTALTITIAVLRCVLFGLWSSFSILFSDPSKEKKNPHIPISIDKEDGFKTGIYVVQLYDEAEGGLQSEGGRQGENVCLWCYSLRLQHIGHALANVAFDVLYRYLKHLKYEVVYVRNFTDVDDKIINRANERGEDPIALSGRFCQEFLVDMDDLQCLHPTHEPRVSDHIVQIKEMVDKIISNGCAYAVDGDVYFSIDNFPTYGQLSKLNLEGNRAGERAAKPNEPSWDSPWGSWETWMA
ncbi:hypothetical protein M9H77_08498 [Catharanthus roseus]|uniref:Uncharacterized protein n=1 Tax=Catharanthus roseus TaxID=4058 RepID=A0ACC0BYD4_CATRO|nr:hypothetical protein M9H77_08498 [Catharanthus roseus]